MFPFSEREAQTERNSGLTGGNEPIEACREGEVTPRCDGAGFQVQSLERLVLDLSPLAADVMPVQGTCAQPASGKR